MRITRDMLADLREEVVVMMGHAPVPDWMAFDLTVGYVEVLDHGSSCGLRRWLGSTGSRRAGWQVR